MIISRVSHSEGFANIIYERKGSIEMNQSFVQAYLREFPSAFLDHGNRIIVERNEGIRVIYFRDDFSDEESYVSLYNYILTGNASHGYYLRSKAGWLRDHDLKELSRFTDSLSEEEIEYLFSQKSDGFVFDEDDYFYRTLIMNEPHEAIVGKWLIESEYRDFPEVLNQDEEYLRYVNHTYSDLYVLYLNTGNTLFQLAETTRKIIDLYSRGSRSEGKPNAILSRRDALQEYSFLFDEDPDRFFSELEEDIPFAEKLKGRLMEKRETFQECIYRLMDEKGITSLSQLTARKGKLGISKAVMSKWINNRDPRRTPNKETVYAIIMAAKLDMKDAAALLKSANLEFGYTPEDIIVRMFIDNKMYDLDKLDKVVFEVTHKTLLNRRDWQIQEKQ